MYISQTIGIESLETEKLQTVYLLILSFLTSFCLSCYFSLNCVDISSMQEGVYAEALDTFS